MAVPTLETKKLEGDAVAQLLGETTTTKPKVLQLPEIMFREFNQLKVRPHTAIGAISGIPTWRVGGVRGRHG